MNSLYPSRRCSRIFHVPQIGAGTAQVESLCGYIARVAMVHLVTPAALLHRCLEWWDTGRPDLVGNWKEKTGALRLRASINSGDTSGRWIELLESLGCVSGLSECTVASWAGIFSARMLIKTHHAWCPSCYQEDQQPYDRLIWSLQEVRACPRHLCQLVELCPNCTTRVPTIHSRSSPGRCHHCGGELFGGEVATRPADEVDLGLAQIAAEFLAHSARQRIAGEVGRNNFVCTLNACMQAAQIADASELARLLNVSRNTTWYWLHGKAVPDFGHTVQICYAFNLSVSDFLAGRVPPSLVPRGTGELALRTKRRKPRAFDESSIARQIDEIRLRRITNPPSLVEVGREVGFEARTLRVHFSNLCREISLAHRTWCRKQLFARREERRNIFRAVIQASRVNYKNPTHGQAMKLLPKPGLMRSEAARHEFRQLLLEIA